MAGGTYDLRGIRERLLRLQAHAVTTATGIALDRLRAIEAGDPPTVAEIETLAQVYGIDADRLWDEPIALASADGIVVLTSLDEYVELGDLLRLKIVRAATAARDLVTLRNLLGDTRTELPSFRVDDPTVEAYRQGALLAGDVRRTLGLGVEPVASMRALVAEHFPAIDVLHADLGTAGPAGLGFADDARGPAIVLNRQGKNENPCVRRFSLAHELCHLLVDRQRGEPLASISGYLSQSGLERERRANSFATRLLCPETFVHRHRQTRPSDVARLLMTDYGMHYAAARLYLRNEINADLPAKAPAELLVSSMPSEAWFRAEEPRGMTSFPIDRVPAERRGTFAQTAARAWSEALIPRDAFARLLGLTPLESVEDVVAFYDLDPPREGVAAA